MTATAQPGPRWDILVRLTHWGVAAAIVANGLMTEEGSELHVWIGYAAGALLALRLFWGFIGPREARFAAFPPSPRRALEHMGDIAAGRRTAHRSHNPLGALMVYALWATLAVVVATGIAMSGLPSTPPTAPSSAERVTSGAEAAAEGEVDDDEEGEGSGSEGVGGEMIEETHEIAANLLFVLAALHVAGVAFETRRSGPGVLKAMVGGQRGKAETG